jgi:hypothetical protein
MRHSNEFIHTTNPKKIHVLLTKYLKNICNKESCWLSHQIGSNVNTSHRPIFAPQSPASWKKNPNEWLSSVDINKVMHQYENTYKCFNFIGPSPIDFDLKEMYDDCVWPELCNFNLNEQIKNNKTKIGIIFNTDTHDKPGQHWISMFINIKKGQIFFFDSVGEKAPIEVKKLVNNIIEQGANLNPPIIFKYDENHPVEHQMKNTECGMYSLYFIIHMLEDKITGHYLKTHIIKDKYVEQFRKIFFN